MSRAWLLVAVAIVALSGGPANSAGEPAVVRLWGDNKAPGETAAVEPEKVERSAQNPSEIQRVTYVAEPALSVFPAEGEKRSSAAVIIAPGGAYRFLSWAHEGEQVARWFSKAGVTAFVLKYRVPTRAGDPGNRLALMDGQRAVSLVRSRAREWGVDPARIGFLGFSAGGNLAAKLQTGFAQRAYPASDAVDQVSCRPDFSVLIYPGGMLDRADPTRLAAEFPVDAKSPPTFLAVAADDTHCADCSLRFWTALRAAGVKAELHLYASGGHGFGMRPSAGPIATWPERVMDWLRASKVL